MPVTPEQFLDALREAVPRWGGAKWLAARVDGEYIVVLYEQLGPLQGARMNFNDFATAVLGPGDHPLESVLGEAVLEIVEPHELGPTLPVTWAEGLTDRPQDVYWQGDALDYYAGRRPSPR